MCFEFEQEYYRRVEEARKALEADKQRQQQQPAVPAKPGERDKTPEQAEPVPV
jgi:hypothetical protein